MIFLRVREAMFFRGRQTHLGVREPVRALALRSLLR